MTTTHAVPAGTVAETPDKLRFFRRCHFTPGELARVRQFLRPNGTTLILPYDQFIEHDCRHLEAASDAGNPDYILRLAVEGGYNAVAIHYGLIPRTNRGIFCINELPDLAERLQVGMVVRRHFRCNVGHGDATAVRFRDQLVIDVRDVHDPRHLVTAVGQIAFDRVEDHRAHHVPDVGLAIHRGAA